MLFLVRSAVCIGFVVCLTSGSEGTATLRQAATTASQVRQFCDATGSCLDLAHAAVSGALAEATEARHRSSGAGTTGFEDPTGSVDTLSAADRVPPWHPPAAEAQKGAQRLAALAPAGGADGTSVAASHTGAGKTPPAGRYVRKISSPDRHARRRPDH